VPDSWHPAKSGKECGLASEIMAKIKEILNYKDRAVNALLSLNITSYWAAKIYWTKDAVEGH